MRFTRTAVAIVNAWRSAIHGFHSAISTVVVYFDD
jgi:hypothetical protein